MEMPLNCTSLQKNSDDLHRGIDKLEMERDQLNHEIESNNENWYRCRR